MRVLDFLKNTQDQANVSPIGFRPPFVCEDGVEISVQAGYAMYSIPGHEDRLFYLNIMYEEPRYFPVEKCECVELAIKYQDIPHHLRGKLNKYYMEYLGNDTRAYAYVPIELVDEIIESHKVSN